MKKYVLWIMSIAMISCFTGCFVKNNTQPPHTSTAKAPHPRPTPPTSVTTNGLKGFENSRNGCFMNATEQVVFNDPLLCNAIKNGLINSSSNNLKEKEAIKIFLKELEIYHNKTTQTIPYNDNLRYFLTTTKNNAQEDAGEFLLALLSKIPHTTQPNLFVAKKDLSRWELLRKLPAQNSDNYSEMPPDNITEVSEKKALPYLTVPIFPHHYNTEVDGKKLIQEMWEWTNVQGGQEAKFRQNGNLNIFKKTKEKLEITPMPPRLLFQLNYFSPNGKTNTHIKMPEKLTLEGQTYKLKAFIRHQGSSAQEGHYTAYINKNSTWYEANDAKITPLQQKLPKEAHKGYIYIYHLN